MLKKTVILLFACWASLSVSAQTVEEIVAQAQQLEKQMKEGEALEKYREALQVSPGHVQAFTQASLLAGREGARHKDKAAKQEYFNNAKIYAYEALKVAPENAEANYAMAVALARIGQISGAKEKVAAAKEVKKYADLALKFKPEYGEAWHLIGKWNFDLYNYGTIEKAAAKVLFGGVPPGTMEDAIAAYEKCLKLKPSFIQNYYDLALAYRQNNQETQGMEVLNKGMRMRPIYQDDPGYKADMKKMLEAMQ
jgi:tetratricopeptide (TPR) repeat protein